MELKTLNNQIKKNFKNGVLIAVVSLFLGIGLNLFGSRTKILEQFLETTDIDNGGVVDMDMVLESEFTPRVGETFSINVLVNPYEYDIEGINGQIIYSNVDLEYIGSSWNNEYFNNSSQNVVLRPVNSQTAGIYFYGYNPPAYWIDEEKIMCHITFRRLNGSETRIEMGQDSAIAISEDDFIGVNTLSYFDVLVIPAATNECSQDSDCDEYETCNNGVCMPGGAPVPCIFDSDCEGGWCGDDGNCYWGGIRLKVSVFGIEKEGINDDFEVQVRSDVGDIVFSDTLEFDSDASGLMISEEIPTDNFNFDYSYMLFYIKGPKHIGKLYRVHKSVVLNAELADDTTLDLNRDIYGEIVPGDLSFTKNDQGNVIYGQQDGVFDMSDYQTLKACRGSYDSDLIKIADLNYDGVVNSLDKSLLDQVIWNEDNEQRNIKNFRTVLKNE